jgi:hypothetical protein
VLLDVSRKRECAEIFDKFIVYLSEATQFEFSIACESSDSATGGWLSPTFRVSSEFILQNEFARFYSSGKSQSALRAHRGCLGIEKR